MRVAFVHDWLVTYRGGEKVLAALLELYPEAPVYTLFYDAQRMPEEIRRREIRYPPLLNALRRGRKLLLPYLPHAIESLPLAGYDLLISTSSCVAKGARKGPRAKHLCYIHSPMRYIWDQQDEYLAGVAHIPGATRAIKALTPRLRAWDIASAARVDRFIANSSFVAQRVADFYGRDAGVLHPPIELSRFPGQTPLTQRGGYLLAGGALVSYKRFDLAIKACQLTGRRLVIAGAGPMEGALRQLAGPETTFEIRPSDQRFATLLAGADALLFPGVEDFGMIAIEAMACGTPVLAFAGGGARDFIQPGVTGDFFADSTPASLADLIAHYAPTRFHTATLAAYAHTYNRENFLTRIRAEIAALLETPAP